MSLETPWAFKNKGNKRLKKNKNCGLLPQAAQARTMSPYE